ncbi:hypothetical protein GGR55DRAFT_704047 [Xylaria sp. FL0064]|nr:hypothetical protein GGR55DRAFT_704047 [Xylaria sp. FL0064]
MDVLPATAEAIADFATRSSEDPGGMLNFTMCHIPRLIEAAVVAILAPGGNVFGLEDYPHDTIVVQTNISVRTPELAEWARLVVVATIKGLGDFAATVTDGLCPLLYLSYVSPEHANFRSYGENNLDEMKKVSSEYDPNGVFQRLCPGVFELVDRGALSLAS